MIIAKYSGACRSRLVDVKEKTGRRRLRLSLGDPAAQQRSE